MERPQVRMIEPQSEETAPANIPSWEAEQLLRNMDINQSNLQLVKKKYQFNNRV